MSIDLKSKPIAGLHGYWVSPCGSVFSFKTNKKRKASGFFRLKPVLDKDGYARFRIGGKARLAHRIVYEAFCGPLVEGMVVAHLDGSRLNNSAENLVQVTQRENIQHKRLHGTWQSGESHPRASIDHKTAEEVKSLLNACRKSSNGWLGRGVAAEIAQKTGASIHVVRDIRRERVWS